MNNNHKEIKIMKSINSLNPLDSSFAEEYADVLILSNWYFKENILDLAKKIHNGNYYDRIDSSRNYYIDLLDQLDNFIKWRLYNKIMRNNNVNTEKNCSFCVDLLSLTKEKIIEENPFARYNNSGNIFTICPSDYVYPNYKISDNISYGRTIIYKNDTIEVKNAKFANLVDDIINYILMRTE